MRTKLQSLLAVAVMVMGSSLAAHAQLTSVDGGLAVTDNNGLMFANTVGFELGWNPSPVYAAYTAQGWLAGLNASDYGGYNNWTLASDDGGVANTTTNQLGELFYADCGNAIGTPTSMSNAGKNCSAFSAVVNANLAGVGEPNNTLYVSGTGSCAGNPIQANCAFRIYGTPTSTSQEWTPDTNWSGIVGQGDVIAVRAAPEIDPASAVAGFTLLIGSLIVLRSRVPR
jgi:hypothetical protein